jgi:hypothetical protein
VLKRAAEALKAERALEQEWLERADQAEQEREGAEGRKGEAHNVL